MAAIGVFVAAVPVALEDVADIDIGDAPAIRRALARGAADELGRDGHTRLTRAARDGARDAVALLLAGVPDAAGVVVRADPRVQANDLHQRMTALHFAAGRGDAAICKLLLLRDATLADESDTLQRTALMLAADHGHAAACRVLLEHGAAVDKQAPPHPGMHFAGNTALAHAIAQGHADVCVVLLEGHTDVNLLAGGRTPLAMSIVYGRYDIFGMLLAIPDIDVERRSIGGYAPLHYAADRLYGAVTMCDRLLKRGADINASRDDGDTPLHVAARAGALQLCKLLVGAGAGLDTVNKLGLPPAAVAGSPETCAYFEALPMEAAAGAAAAAAAGAAGAAAPLDDGDDSMSGL